MKKLILFLLLFIIASAAVIAQKQTTVYCKMTIEPDAKFKQKIFVDFGTNNNLFAKDSSVVNNLIKAKSFTNGVDAMNYMSSIGWGLITIMPWAGTYTCFYKKELEK